MRREQQIKAELDRICQASEEEFVRYMGKLVIEWTKRRAHYIRPRPLLHALIRVHASVQEACHTATTIIHAVDSELSEALGEVEPTYSAETAPWREEE